MCATFSLAAHLAFCSEAVASVRFATVISVGEVESLLTSVEPVLTTVLAHMGSNMQGWYPGSWSVANNKDIKEKSETS